jgi:hypothetical protein
LSYLESNLSILATRQPQLATLLRNTTNQKLRVFPSSSGLPSASWENGSSSHALHSRYDPLRDARHNLKRQQYAGADYVILLGFGLGYILDALLEETNATSRHYFIIESNPEILRAAFDVRDLSLFLSLPHLHFAWPVSGPELAEQWRSFFDPVYAQSSAFLTDLPCVALNTGLFKAAAEIIQSQTFQIFTDINTLVAKSQDFLDNFVQNLLKAAGSPGVIKFAGMFPGMPAVIVSAGPSLDKNIHELRGFEDKILILSTDTALKPLLAAGIDPHFVLTGDPSYTNYLHLKDAPSQQALLVAEATSYPAVFAEFDGKTITCIFENSALRSLSDLLGNKGTLRAWGSVATMALDFALLLQCNPITFMGQDLAHTDGRIYCSGIRFDEEWFAGIADPEAWQTKLKALRAGRRTIMAEDIHGKPVETTDKLASYWNWMLKVFRDHPDVRFINATEGGILKEAENSSLREVLHRCCGRSLDLRNRIAGIFREAQQNSLLYSGVNLSVLTGEVVALQDVLRVGFELCKMTNVHTPQDLLKRLEYTKKSIYFNPHLAPLLDSFNQMGNVQFLRKRRNISQQPLNLGLLPEIRQVYLDFFTSVEGALSKIKTALSRIESDLNFESGPPLLRPSPNPTETTIPSSSD